jgi:Fe-S oxidoreductase
MAPTKRLMGYTLSTLRENLQRSGDPLGLRFPYWGAWSRGRGLAQGGTRLLMTGRMYQMLPYIQQATDMIPAVRRMLAVKGADRLLAAVQRRVGNAALRLLAARRGTLQRRATRALQGIAAGLQQAGCRTAYHPAADPYGGALLHDLGLQDDARAHLAGVLAGFQRQGIREIITVDPHTTWMLRMAARDGLAGDIRVQHYLEIFDGPRRARLTLPHGPRPASFVLHDACVLTRELGLGERVRQLAGALGATLALPADAGCDTACCGGPVEYAFPELSCRVSALRARELARHGNQILVTCPICLVNLARHEKDLGIRVWDLGELLWAGHGRALEGERG